MTDAKLTVELLDELEEKLKSAYPLPWGEVGGVRGNANRQLVEVAINALPSLIAVARASLDLQAYDELRRDGISVGAAQQAWHMAHAACGALGLIYEETAPADIAAAVYAESAPSAPSQPAESPWVAIARWCTVHARDRRVGCNQYATDKWIVWVEWNDDAVETGRGQSAEAAALDLCDKLRARHPSSALPAPPEPTNGR